MRYTLIQKNQPDSDGHTYAFVCEGDGNAEAFLPVYRWCVAQFGPILPVPHDEARGTRCCYGSRTFTVWFRDEVDAFAFKMRWC